MPSESREQRYLAYKVLICPSQPSRERVKISHVIVEYRVINHRIRTVADAIFLLFPLNGTFFNGFKLIRCMQDSFARARTRPSARTTIGHLVYKIIRGGIS